MIKEKCKRLIEMNLLYLKIQEAVKAVALVSVWFGKSPVLYLCRYLKVGEEDYEEFVDGLADASLGFPGQKDERHPQQRDQDQGGSHCLHVGCGLSTVGLPQLGDQNPDDVEEKEKVHLDSRRGEMVFYKV